MPWDVTFQKNYFPKTPTTPEGVTEPQRRRDEVPIPYMNQPTDYHSLHNSLESPLISIF